MDLIAEPTTAPAPPPDWTLADLPAPIQAVLIDWLAAGARARWAGGQDGPADTAREEVTLS